MHASPMSNTSSVKMSNPPKAIPPTGKARRSVVAQPMGTIQSPNAYKFPPKKSSVPDTAEDAHLIGFDADWNDAEDFS